MGSEGLEGGNLQYSKDVKDEINEGRRVLQPNYTGLTVFSRFETKNEK
jgi:hypothetical protein